MTDSLPPFESNDDIIRLKLPTGKDPGMLMPEEKLVWAAPSVAA
jgi:hypothetical protein